MLKELTEEVFKKIVSYNSKGDHEAIPHSDAFEKELQALIGISNSDFHQIITILKDAHKIFSFEIIKKDADNDVQRVDGYVEANLQTIRKLKSYFQKLLMDEFEKQNNKRLLVNQIVKEFYNRPAFFKNTLLGQIGNKAIMLNEYEGLLERNFNEYTDSWKAQKYAELIDIESKKMKKKTEAAGGDGNTGREPPGQNQRAVDSPLYAEYSADRSKQSIDKVLQIYGVDFFFRIHLRKYNFDLLLEVLESGKINRRSDLMHVKDLIQKMKANTGKDPKLLDYTDRIYKLERVISRQMLHGR